MIYNEHSISTSYNKKPILGFLKLTGISNIDIEKYTDTDFKNLFKVKK